MSLKTGFFRRRLHAIDFSLLVGFFLFFITVGPLFAALWVLKVQDPFVYLLSATPFVGGLVLMTVLAGLFPSILGDQKVRFPWTLLISTLFCILSSVTCQAVALVLPPIVTFDREIRSDLLMTDVPTFGCVLGWQFAVLTMGSKLSRENKDGEK